MREGGHEGQGSARLLVCVLHGHVRTDEEEYIAAHGVHFPDEKITNDQRRGLHIQQPCRPCVASHFMQPL